MGLGPSPGLPLAARFRHERHRMIVGLQVLLLLTSALLVLLVLLHKGKGGGLSDLFGGGVSSSVGGSARAERNLDRITVALALIWLAAVIALGLLLTPSF